MKKVLVLLCTILMAIGFSASAGAYTVNYNAGTTYNTTALAGHATYGDELAGMTVIATFADASVDTQIWASTGTGAGGVSSGDWALMVTGDTWGNDVWSLACDGLSPLTNVFIDAGTGDAVFDVINGLEYSPNSFSGKPFATDYTGSVDATYTDLVGVAGVVYDDLYRTMNLAFDGGFTGFFTFTADMDNLSLSGDLSVPEPATMLLLGSGLIGLVGFRRKKLFKE